MSLNLQDDQPKKAQKSGITFQGQGKSNQAKQGNKPEKAKVEKVRKKKKRRKHLRQCNRQGQTQDGSLILTGANAVPVPAIGGGGQKKKKTRDGSEITYDSCNKKGHYTSNYIKPKN